MIILIIVVALWLLRLFLPYILKWLIVRQQRRFAQQFQDAMGGGNYDQKSTQNQTKQKQGEVTIKTQNANQKVVSKNVGEAVDFEEITGDF